MWLSLIVYRNKEFLKENVVVLGIFQEDLLIICLFLFNVWVESSLVAFLCGVGCSRCLYGFFCRYSNFLPQCKDIHGFRLTGDSELTIGVNASVGGLTVFVLTLQQVSGLSWVYSPSCPMTAWIASSPSMTPSWISGREWMDVFPLFFCESFNVTTPHHKRCLTLYAEL